MATAHSDHTHETSEVREQGLTDRIGAFFDALIANFRNAKEAFMSGEAGKAAMGMGLGGFVATLTFRFVVIPLIKRLRQFEASDFGVRV